MLKSMMEVDSVTKKMYEKTVLKKKKNKKVGIKTEEEKYNKKKK